MKVYANSGNTTANQDDCQRYKIDILESVIK